MLLSNLGQRIWYWH